MLFFGYSIHEVPTLKPMNVFKMVNEFALEYRTTRDKILQQKEKTKNFANFIDGMHFCSFLAIPMNVFKMVNEFALEYRTTRDKILQQRKRLADKRERNKTRGKIWALENGQNDNKDGMELNGNLKRAPIQMNAEQRHEAMSRMLTGGSNDDTLKRTRAKPTAERSPADIISSQRESMLFLC
ncbi:unnamed protein product [Wuchereria bancrofti]|uniref:FH2 domain-containing protein n=1 Tax=Wuchereria bancrofti TaxID=6293 RepID=A0A3P7DYY2_WUCBA|nr:unnamed protein product [Wuchereria bancrofti]